jgi:hypothetical protein
MRRTILLLASVAILAATAGCSLCPCCRRCGTCCSGGPEPPLAAVERTSQELAIQELAAAVQPPEPSDDSQVPTDYRALSPQQCQCLAAKHAPLADGLDTQRLQLEQKKSKKPCLREDKSAKQREFQESMLLYSALEIRDQAAGTALEWYYQLAGAEAKTDLLNESLKEGRKTLQGIQGLKNQGLPLPAPFEEYQRQVVELQLQESQNQLAIEQLNSKLRQAIGQDSKAGRISPDPRTPLGMENPPDVEAAVQRGLHQRAQLLLLRGMIDNLDRDTLGSARSFLQMLNPLLAMSSPGPNCKLLKILGKILHIQPGQEAEIERVRAQLSDYLRERERTVEAEIRNAVYEIRARRQATILARQAADSWQERIRNLEKQRAEGIRSVTELSKTYLDWYKARGEVVKEFVGWKIAVVKLKMAQGVLPAECGYPGCNGDRPSSAGW